MLVFLIILKSFNARSSSQALNIDHITFPDIHLLDSIPRQVDKIEALNEAVFIVFFILSTLKTLSHWARISTNQELMINWYIIFLSAIPKLVVAAIFSHPSIGFTQPIKTIKLKDSFASETLLK